MDSVCAVPAPGSEGPAGPAVEPAGANHRFSSRRVADGATTESPRATARIPARSSGAVESLSRKPEAPARIAATR